MRSKDHDGQVLRLTGRGWKSACKVTPQGKQTCLHEWKSQQENEKSEERNRSSGKQPSGNSRNEKSGFQNSPVGDESINVNSWPSWGQVWGLPSSSFRLHWWSRSSPGSFVHLVDLVLGRLEEARLEVCAVKGETWSRLQRRTLAPLSLVWPSTLCSSCVRPLVSRFCVCPCLSLLPGPESSSVSGVSALFPTEPSVDWTNEQSFDLTTNAPLLTFSPNSHVCIVNALREIFKKLY